MYTNTNIHATADGREMHGRLAGTCVAVTGMMMAIWYAKGVAQKVLEESNREDAEEGRAEGRMEAQGRRRRRGRQRGGRQRG